MITYLICSLISKNIFYGSCHRFEILNIIVGIRCHFKIICSHGSRERQRIGADTIYIGYIFDW